MSWCYHCNKDIQTTYMDGHLWSKHHTTMNTDPNIEAVRKQNRGKAVQKGLWDCVKYMFLGYTGVHVIFQKPKEWSLLTRAIAIGAGFYAVRKGIGVYDWFKKAKGIE